MSLLVSSSWAMFGQMINDQFVIIPNVLGAVLAGVRVTRTELLLCFDLDQLSATPSIRFNLVCLLSIIDN